VPAVFKAARREMGFMGHLKKLDHCTSAVAEGF